MGIFAVADFVTGLAASGKRIARPDQPGFTTMDQLATNPNHPPKSSPHSLDSSLREQAIGHLFLGQLLAHMWCTDARDIEVLKAEVDRSGYDLVLESRGIIRHVQLKSRFRGSTVNEIDVSTKLLGKPGGCVIWIEFDPGNLELLKFYWFGGPAGTALPDLGDRVSRHSKANSLGEKTERPGLRVVSKGRFQVLTAIQEVANNLFG